MTGGLRRWLIGLIRLFGDAFLDALPTLLALWHDLFLRLRRWRREKRRPQRVRRQTRGHCVPISEPAYKRPDPMIYSQTYLMKLGLGVSWDNPDIQLYKEGGIPVPSSHLEPDTTYDIIARIWNNSTEAPVIDLPVRFSYLSFGVGTQSYAIGDTQVRLGVKGGSHHPAFASITWRTPSAAGHYCIQVLLDWLDDANPHNNLGQENTNVGELSSPVQFTFALRNPTYESLRYRFEVDAYQIPKQQPCREVDKDKNPRYPNAQGDRRPLADEQGRYILPVGWVVGIEPRELELASGGEQLIRVIVNAPDDFNGRQPINIHAFNRYGLAGGMTFYVESR